VALRVGAAPRGAANAAMLEARAPFCPAQAVTCAAAAANCPLCCRRRRNDASSANSGTFA